MAPRAFPPRKPKSTGSRPIASQRRWKRSCSHGSFLDCALKKSALAHRPATTYAAGEAGKAGQSLAYDSSKLESLRALKQLAPANGREIAAWALLCLLVGFIEEIVFRGYLQRQFIGWARGSVGLGVLASAVVFGSAHAYEGARGMVLITVFGVLFSLLALYRRSLRAGIFAHAWHDLIAGLAIALLRSNHVI